MFGDVRGAFVPFKASAGTVLNLKLQGGTAMYSYDEVMTFVEEEDVKFIRLAFCDIHGRQKNISIMPVGIKACLYLRRFF